MEDWLTMGGYGAYIWSAYGLSALGLGGLGYLTWRSYLTAKRRAQALGVGQKG